MTLGKESRGEQFKKFPFTSNYPGSPIDKGFRCLFASHSLFPYVFGS
jgi:hypothetical protein